MFSAWEAKDSSITATLSWWLIWAQNSMRSKIRPLIFHVLFCSSDLEREWWSQQKPKDICWNLTKCVFCPSKVAILTATDNLLWSPCPRLRFWWTINLAKVGILYFYGSKNNTHTYLDPFSTNGDYALCSRDFQNVLIWSFHDFTATQTYVKSNFGELKRSKNVIFGNLGDSEFWILVNLGLESCTQLLKIKIQNL